VRNLLRLGVSTFAPLTLLVACDDKPSIIDPPDPPVPDSCPEVQHPLDKALCAELYDTGYRPVLALDAEVCGRLWVDLTGARATADQLQNECIGKPIEAVIEAAQASDAYRRTQRRYWADRLSYSDALVDPGSIKALDALVDELYRGQISYHDFAIRALAHPGFVGRHNGYGQPDMVARAAFDAFLGRPATRPEALDLGNLWRPWVTNGFRGGLDGARAPDAYYGMGTEPWIDPQACAAGVNTCESALLGNAALEFPANGRTQWIELKDLTPEDWESLRAPGRLFVTLDAFWEAQVDDVLVRYLGYDLGALRPKARQALVDIFEENGGDVLELERIVLTSWAYRQTAEELPSTPRPEVLKNIPFAYGPTKLMIAESWLQSIGSIIGRSMGECDWRYPNLPEYALPPESIAPLEDVYPRNGDGTFDLTFRNSARVLGGCPGSFDYGSFSVTGRSNHIGLITAVAQEEELVKICFLGDVPALFPAGLDVSDTRVESIEATARHVLERIRLDPADLGVEEVVETVMSDCSDCDVDAVARGLCSGLLGGIRFLTY
jgi:hypothetical protein